MLAWRVCLPICILLAGGAAAAEVSTAAPVMRVGEHPGYDRVVFDLPDGMQATAVQQAANLVVKFTAPATLVPASRPPRNALQVTSALGEVTIVLASRVRVRQTRLANRFVLDLLDPTLTNGAAAPMPPASPNTSLASPAAPLRPAPRAAGIRSFPADRHVAVAPDADLARPAEVVMPALPPAISRRTEPVAAPPTPAGRPQTEPAPPERSRSVSASPLAAPSVPLPTRPLALAASVQPGGDGLPAILLPFGSDVGAAAFRAGGMAIVVFDDPRPIDLSQLAGQAFADARVQMLPAATLLRLPLPSGSSLRLSRERDGWRVAVASAPAEAGKPIRPEIVDGRLHLPADGPGRVVSIPNVLTDGVLLVGTQRQSGQSVALGRRTPAFALLPSWQGVVVEPVTDALTLRTVPDGFTIGADAAALALAPQDADTLAQADAAGFSRRFDLPSLALMELQRRLHGAIETAATAPAQGRLRPRLKAAEAMLALGLGVEAQALLHVAAADAPNEADDPDLVALSAIAAMLAGRPDEAGGIDDPRLNGSDEIALWRAIRVANREPAASSAAAVFAGELPLLRAYPAPLRNRLLPLALQTMALGGEAGAVRHLLTDAQPDAALELARGMALEAAARAGGDPAQPLTVYDKLAQGTDRSVRARAAARGTELRLVTGGMTPGQAADALEKRLFAWRGDAEEVALRMRVADLRRQSGAWRQALALLRDTENLWPDQRVRIHARLSEVFADALAQDARDPLPPLDLVALVDENADLLTDGEAGRALATHVADRFSALDLPKRVAPVLEKVLAASTAAVPRAELGERIAELRLEQGDGAGALAAIGQTDSPDLPPALRNKRALTFARSAAAQGDLARATAALADIDTAEAEELRATLLERAKAWPEALAALKQYASHVVPERGALDENQSLTLLRLASAAAEAGDDVTLARLRDHDLGRVPAGRIADMITLLTGQPVRAFADLPMVSREAALTRNLPDALKSLSLPATRPVAAR